jgi:uncharacterized protein
MAQKSTSISARAYIVRRYVPREIAPTIKRMLEHMPVVVVTGMRQVGKTTMLVNDPLFDDRDYISLDDTAVQLGVKENPDELLSSYKRVTIDEAQKDKDLFRAVKRVVHADKSRGRFILSGSSTLPLREATAESLAGDAIYLQMGPLTRREVSRITDRPPFLPDFIKKPRRLPAKAVTPISAAEVTLGGMPGVVLPSREAGRVWLAGYEQTYLERDILYLKRIESLSGFKALLSLLATRTAQILNVDQLARDLGNLSRNTVERYIDLLEQLFVVHQIQAYSRNVRVRVRKHPKVMLADSGIACYLAGVRDASSHPLKGFMYETYVYQNLAGILQAHAPDWNIYYWRVDNKKEVDFVVDTKEQAVGIEVKASEIVRAEDTVSLRAFKESAADCRLCILAYNGHEVVNLGEGIWAVPLGLLLS